MLSQRQFCVFFIIFAGADSCMRKRARIDVKCPSDQHRTAEEKLTSAVLKWSKSDFKIQSTYPVRGIFQTVPIYGASANIEKEFGEGSHYVEYKAVDDTGKYDSCSFTVSVTVTRCSKLFNPDLGIVSCDADNIYGSRCSVSCVPGHTVLGNSSIYCQGNGEWSEEIPRCIAQTCADPGTPLGGFRTCTTRTHSFGSICSFSCNHGYYLDGLPRLICEVSRNGSTQWSSDVPQCRRLTPPRVDICPETIRMTSGSVLTEVAKPDIRFTTAEGHQAPYTCSYFGNQKSHAFTLGFHTVTCTAFDPIYGGESTSQCIFDVIIEANPCRPLPTPQNGFLVCSRASTNHDTSCQLYCDDGYVLPWQGGTQVDHFYCDRNGDWNPYYFVPSCVQPQRPKSLMLPTEMVYTSSANCSDTSHLSTISSRFIVEVRETIRSSPSCTGNPDSCEVVDNMVECRLQQHPSLPSSRRKRYVTLATVYGSESGGPDKTQEQPLESFDVYSATATPFVESYFPKDDSDDSDLIVQEDAPRQGDAITVHENSPDRHNFIVAIKFHFQTNVRHSGGGWPDEYHNAEKRLNTMFDHLEFKVLNGSFTLQDQNQLGIVEVRNSLAYTDKVQICSYLYNFHEPTLMCISCGPGAYLNTAINDCELCPVGQYQPHSATICKSCPKGTTTMDEGANNISQCIEIDECSSNPCQNGAVCEDRSATYECVCNSGFAGKNCDLVIFDCSRHSCQNGGSCSPLNETDYVCSCRPSYYGDYCQYQSIHGNFGDWSEWSECTQSCEGGVQLRRRSCDSPPPTNGGDDCVGASVEERMCNLHECPECTRLRRPYAGNLQCTTNTELDLISCTISCPPGYDFSGPVLDVYTCGRNTSYLWPHESPDNPRCALPACTKQQEREAEAFNFEATVRVPCDEATRREVSRELHKRAAEYTQHVTCIQDGSCHLPPPEVAECAPTHRGKRHVTLQDLKITVSVLYEEKKLPYKSAALARGKQASDLETVSKQLSDVADNLLSSRSQNQLLLDINGTTVNVNVDNASTEMLPVCPRGTMVAPDSETCVECGPGSFYHSDLSTCVLCQEGSYQPDVGQYSCLPCPKGDTTFGRGAKYRLECYNGTTPPDIPEDITNIPEAAQGCGGWSLILAVCVPVMAVVLVLIVVCILYKKRKTSRKRKYRVSKSFDPAASEVMLRSVTPHEDDDQDKT